MSKKKKRGVPTLYSESKVKVGVSLTPTGAKRLGDIAKELGLSRSEFVERIARGEFEVSGSGSETTVTLATGSETDSKNPTTNLPQKPVENHTEIQETQSSDNQAAADLTQLQERYQTLQSQSQQQAETIDNLNQQLEKVSQLESQLAESVPTSDYNSLQKQLEEQTETVATLNQQLEKVSQLESQLAESVPTSDYNSLQKQLEEQTETVATLNQQLEKVSQLESQLAESVPTSDYNSLQKQLEEQQATISQFKQELETQNVEISELKEQVDRMPELETQLAQNIASQSINSPENSVADSSWATAPSQPEIASEPHNVAIASEYSNGSTVTGDSGNQVSLQQTVQDQEKTIHDLRKQIIELQRLATIGEARLSKWRNYTFSR